MSEMFRDPRYMLPLGILMGVIIVSAWLVYADYGIARSAASPPVVVTVTAPGGQGAGEPQPTLEIDQRRALDLAKIREALKLYHKRRGSYPTTGGVLAPICNAPADAGCALAIVAQKLPFTDGVAPYWYASDGSTYYTLVAQSVTPGDQAQCPPTLPAELAVGPVICSLVQASR